MAGVATSGRPPMGATGGKVAECASVVENSPHSMAPLRCSRRRQPPSKVPDPADRKALQTPAARSGSGVGTVASCRSDGTASASQAAGAKHDAATPPPRPAVLTRPNSRAPSRPHARTSLLPEAQNSGMVGRSARGRPTRLPAAGFRHAESCPLSYQVALELGHAGEQAKD